MNALISNPEPAQVPSKMVANVQPKRSLWGVAFEWFGRIMAVASGIVTGVIVAYIIALFAGWVDIGC